MLAHYISWSDTFYFMVDNLTKCLHPSHIRLSVQVRLWDVESKTCIGVGIGHMGAVGAVAFSKKRRDFFVSGSRQEGLILYSYHFHLHLCFVCGGIDQQFLINDRSLNVQISLTNDMMIDSLVCHIHALFCTPKGWIITLSWFVFNPQNTINLDY